MRPKSRRPPSGTSTGKLIEAGSTLRFGLHYHPSNVPVVDTSSVAVWLVRNEITHELHSSVVADGDLKIPPFDPNYEVELPDGLAARCNPITGPPSCRSSFLE